MVTRAHRTRAKAIQRRTGLPFHLATRFLPERVRHPTYVLYAFFRMADQVVDGTAWTSPVARRATLKRYREGALGRRPPADEIIGAMAEIVDSNGIPPAEIETFIDAMLEDVDHRPYRTLAELDGYMRGSAVSVGRMVMAVMAPADPLAARPHADALGEAFQLTNFLRDVREDRDELDRVYLPVEVLERHGGDLASVEGDRADPALVDAIEELLVETERRYREGVAGIDLLPSDCQFAVLLAAVYYAEYHRQIRNAGYDVLADPPSMSRARLGALVVRTAVSWWRHRDPERVFYAVSPVDPMPEPIPTEAPRDVAAVGPTVDSD
ncbi:MAG: phytoene/squalene synthase family protein [Halobacteriota archaeon]